MRVGKQQVLNKLAARVPGLYDGGYTHRFHGKVRVKRFVQVLRVWIALLSSAMTVWAQKPFPVISTVDAPSIAGRPVALDAKGKLLPWPMPENTGYSYSGYFLSQWTILWDQYSRQRLPYYFCCFDFDRTTFELVPGP